MREININKTLIDRYNNEQLKPKENEIPEINIDPSLVENYNQNGNTQTGTNPSLERAIIDDRTPKFNPTLKRIDELTFRGGVNEDEKTYLKNIVESGAFTQEEIDDSIKTVAGEHKNQEGFQTWYKSPETGLPIPLKPGQKAPEGLRLASVWGDQKEDEGLGATIGKNLANAIPQFIGALEDVGAVGQTLITGEEPNWYKAGKLRLEALEMPTSVKSQESILNTENIKSFSDLLDSDRYHFTPENLAGTISQGVSSIAQFMAANALTGGVATGVTTAAKLAPTAAKIARLTAQGVASATINMGEVLDIAEEAGLEGRNKALFGLLVSMPIAAVEMNMGITGKILGNAEAKAAKNVIAKNAVKYAVKDEAGLLTEKSISNMYKEVVAGSGEYAMGIGKKIAINAGEEASEEALQSFIKNSGAQIYDKLFAGDAEVGKGKFGIDATSAESFGGYLNDAIAGALTGGPSALVIGDKQSKSAFSAVQEDKGVALKAQLNGLKESGEMNQQDYDLAIHKIDGYNKYNDQIVKSKIELSKEDKRRIFDLTWSNENLQTQIERIGDKPTGVDIGILAGLNKTLSSNNKEINDIITPKVAQGQSAEATSITDEKKEVSKPNTATTPKPKNDAAAKMASKIAANEVKKTNGESQSNKETVVVPVKVEKIEPEKVSQSNKKEDEKTVELPKETVPAKAEKVEPVKSETKVEKVSETKPVEGEPTIDEKLDDEVKDEMVTATSHAKVVEKLKTSTKEKKQIAGTVIDRGGLYNNQLAVEMKVGKEKVIVPISSTATKGNFKGKHGLEAHKYIGKRIQVKLVPKEEWNPKGESVDNYGNAYGDRLDVMSDDKVIGTLLVTDRKVEDKKLADKIEKEKAQKQEMIDSNEAKMPKERIASIAERIAKRAVEEQAKFVAKKKEKESDPNNPVKQGGPISDEDVMIAFWKLVEKVALKVIDLQTALKNLRKGLKESSMSSTAKLNLETELYKETKEALAEIDAIEKDEILTAEEKEKQQLKVANDYTQKVTSAYGSNRVVELTNKVREIYTGVPGFKNDAEIEKMLVEISHREVPFDQDFDKSLADLREEGEKEGNEQKMNLALHLNDKSEKQLIQLFNVFRNTEYLPYIKIKTEYNKHPDYSPSNSEYELNLIDQVTKNVSELSENEYGKLHDEIEHKKLFKYSVQNEQTLLNYLNKVTGLSKSVLNRYMTAPSFKDKEAAYVRLYNQTVYGAKSFGLEKPDTKEQFLNNIGASKKGKGSPVNTIALNTPFKEVIEANILTKFKNVSWDNKASGDLTTHLSNMMNRISDSEYDESNPIYGDNSWVQETRKRGVPLAVYFDGLYVDQQKNATSGDMVAEDIRKTIATNYDSNKMEEGYYLQNIGQFGDKDKMAFVPAKRYKTIEEATAKYEAIVAKQNARTGKNINAQEAIGRILADGSEFQTYLKGGSEDVANLFALNYAINYNEISEFINGVSEDYAKKGKASWIDIFKRGGSVASPGISLNKYVDGGVGENHKLIVINKPITSVQDKKDFALSDGQEFISREYSDMVNKSSGGMFDTIIKAITSYTESTGKRVLIKTNAIVIDDLVTMFPENDAYKAIKALMVNGVHRIVTEDGAKYKGNAETLKIFKDKSFEVIPHTVSDKNILTVKTEDYLVQQDLVHDGKLSKGSTPIQRVKNMLKANSAEAITKLYNKLGKDQIDALRNELTALEPKQFRNYLLEKLKYTEDEIQELTDTLAEEEDFSKGDTEYIEQLLLGNISYSHPHLHKWLQTFVANIITKEALGRITNKGLFVEMGHMPSKDFILNDMKVVDGKVQLPEIAISELSGLKVGEYVMVTRIPADDMHSHTLAVVKYLLPASMKNVIITNSESQYISGSDFDGDQRTVEGLFKDKKGNVIEDDSIKGIANKAFKKDMEWFFDPKNVKNATTPIDTGFADDILKELPVESEKENDSPETFTQARINNKVGLAVVGNMANLQAVYDYLKKHKSFLKVEINFPTLSLKKGETKYTGSVPFGKFKNDDDIKAMIGNLLNLALDNVKDPKIEKLGLNEVTNGMFVMALSQGVPMESVVAFFNSPVVKEYVARVRKTKSTDSAQSEFDVMRDMVMQFDPGSAMEKNPLSVLPANPVFNTKTINDPESVEVLSLLNTLNKASKDFNKIHNVIKSTENAKKSWADWKYGSNVLTQVINNQLEYIDTETFKGSPYIELANESLAVSKVFLEKQAPEMTTLGKDVVANIYKALQPDYKGAKAKNFSKKQLEDISKATQSILLNNSRKRSDDFKVWSQKFALKINNLMVEGKYPDLMNALEIVDDKVYDKVWDDKNHKFRSESVPNIKKVSLRQDFKQSMPESEVAKFQKSLTELSKSDPELLKELIDYSAFQYNLAQSRFGGSYASLFTKGIHMQIGKDLDAELEKWNDPEYVSDNSTAITNSITENNPSVNPLYKTDFKKQMGLEKGRPIYQPNIKNEIKITISPKALAEITSGVRNQFSIDQTQKTENAAVAMRIKPGTILSLKVEGKKEVVNKEVLTVGKTKEGWILIKLKPIQQQKTSSEPANKKLQKVIDKVQNSFPKVKVVYDNALQAAGELSADDKTVSINPGYAGLDTPIHEFGHVLIDAMGGISNMIIAKGVEQLKESELWKETELKYPELSQEMLAKEVLAEAIGREGKDLFKESEKQSKFMSWLSSLFFRLGVKLGIQKNVAKNLASQILSGKDLGLEIVAGKEKQQQKKSEKEEDDGEEYHEPTEKEIRAEKVEELKKGMIKNWQEYAQKISESIGEEYIVSTIKKEFFDLKEKIAATDDEKKKKEYQDKIDELKSRDDEFKKGYEKYKEDLEKALKEYVTVELKTQDIGQLQEYYFRMKSMDMLATSDIVKDILSNIAVKLGEAGVQFQKEIDPSYNEEITTKEDIKKHLVWMRALSDFSEQYPEMQELARIYSKHVTAAVEQRGALMKEITDAEKAVIKEYNESKGITEKIKDFFDPYAENSKYYSFMTDSKGDIVRKYEINNGKKTKIETEEYKALTEAQKNFLNIYTARQSQFASLSGNRIFGDNGLIKVERTFSEEYKKGKDGILEAYMHYTGNVGRNENNAILKYKDKDGKEHNLTFKEIKSRIVTNVGKGILSKIEGIYQTTRYKLRAKDVVNKKFHETGKEYHVDERGEYGIENGKIISKFNAPYSKDKTYSMDHGRALREFVSDMVFIENMKDVVPVVESLEYFNQLSSNNRPYLKEWLDIWKKGNILKEVMPSLGGKYDEAIRFLRVWTQLRVMAFNIPAGLMNVFIGKYNQFRGDTWEHMKIGEKRYWLKGLKSAKKARAFDKHLQIVSIQESSDPTYRVSNLFNDLAFGMTKMGEHYIQLSAVIGQMSEEEWGWVKEDGTIEGKNANEVAERTAKIKDSIAKYKKKVADIQGKYSENEKRNFSHFEAGRAIGQFKVWMPDAYRDRFQGSYTDIHGNKRQGTLNHLISKASLDMLRQLKNKDGWKKLMSGTDKDSVLFRRNLRSAMFMIPFIIAWLGGSDDDDDKFMAQQLTKMLGDMSFAFNISQGEFIAQNPVAALSTAHDALKTLHSVVMLQEYKNNSKSHEKGDFKFTNELQGMAPYKNIWKVADQIAED